MCSSWICRPAQLCGPACAEFWWGNSEETTSGFTLVQNSHQVSPFGWCWAYDRRRQWQPIPVHLPGKSHGWRSLVGYSPWGREELDTTEQLHFHFSLSCIGEGNGYPLQYFCLENLRDGRAWWAAVYRVAQNRTQLMQLSSSSSRAYDKVKSCLLEMLIHPKFRVMEWPWRGGFPLLEHFKYSPRCREECVPSGKAVFIF